MKQRPFYKSVVSIAAVLGIAAATLTACGSDGESTADPVASETALPEVQFSQELHDSLPESVKSSNTLKLAGFQFPPYAYFKEDGKTLQGMYVEVADELEKVFGVDIEFEILPSIGDVATSLKSDRFDASLSSLADLPTTEESFDFADWFREYVSFMVKKDNPKGINSLEDTCGTSIATLQGGPSEKVLKEKTIECTASGQDPIDIKTFADQNSAVLAVRSGRADAAFSQQIPLTYYVSQDPNFELAGTNQANGFPDLYFGAYALKGRPVINSILGAFEELREAGVYDALLKKYDIEANRLETFGINLATANGS
jgi:polar amino acid transport system substrate-binding protein